MRNQVGEKLTKSSQTSGFYGFFAGIVDFRVRLTHFSIWREPITFAKAHSAGCLRRFDVGQAVVENWVNLTRKSTALTLIVALQPVLACADITRILGHDRWNSVDATGLLRNNSRRVIGAGARATSPRRLRQLTRLTCRPLGLIDSKMGEGGVQ
jgi:hypothetical protein